MDVDFIKKRNILFWILFLEIGAQCCPTCHGGGNAAFLFPAHLYYSIEKKNVQTNNNNILHDI